MKVSLYPFIQNSDGIQIKLWKYYIILHKLKSFPKELLDDFDKEFDDNNISIISHLIYELEHNVHIKNFDPTKLSSKEQKHFKRISNWWEY